MKLVLYYGSELGAIFEWIQNYTLGMTGFSSAIEIISISVFLLPGTHIFQKITLGGGEEW